MGGLVVIKTEAGMSLGYLFGGLVHHLFANRASDDNCASALFYPAMALTWFCRKQSAAATRPTSTSIAQLAAPLMAASDKDAHGWRLVRGHLYEYVDPDRSWRFKKDTTPSSSSETVKMVCYMIGSIISSVSLVTASKTVFQRGFAFPVTTNAATYIATVVYYVGLRCLGLYDPSSSSKLPPSEKFKIALAAVSGIGFMNLSLMTNPLTSDYLGGSSGAATVPTPSNSGSSQSSPAFNRSSASPSSLRRSSRDSSTGWVHAAEYLSSSSASSPRAPSGVTPTLFSPSGVTEASAKQCESARQSRSGRGPGLSWLFRRRSSSHGHSVGVDARSEAQRPEAAISTARGAEGRLVPAAAYLSECRRNEMGAR